MIFFLFHQIKTIFARSTPVYNSCLCAFIIVEKNGLYFTVNIFEIYEPEFQSGLLGVSINIPIQCTDFNVFFETCLRISNIQINEMPKYSEVKHEECSNINIIYVHVV